MTSKDIEFIQSAVLFLEKPSLFIRAINTVGKPMEKAQKLLPENLRNKLTKAVDVSLTQGLAWAIETVPGVSDLPSRREVRRIGHLHTAATGLTGAIGGFFGAISIPIELPITTMIMLRSIADIAQKNGENLKDPTVRLECMQILSMGSPRSSNDDEMESSYYSQRLAFARIVELAGTYIGTHTSRQIVKAIEDKTAPQLVRFIARIASEFEIVVTHKMLSETIPLIGAVGGASINAGFTEYFNKSAFYHFGLKSLERKHSLIDVTEAYSEALKKLNSKSQKRLK